MTETIYATQQVGVLPGQGWPPAGIECCVVRGRPRLRSVHRERAGCVIEPRKGQVRSRRCLKGGRPHRRPCSGLGPEVRRGRRAGHVRTGQPHIKSLSYQQLISECIVQSCPDPLLPVADLRLLTLEQVHRHMANHPNIVRGIASTDPAFIFAECHVQSPMQAVLDASVRTHRLLKELHLTERGDVVALLDTDTSLAITFGLHHPDDFQSTPLRNSGQRADVGRQEIAPVLDSTVAFLRGLLVVYLRAVIILLTGRVEIPRTSASNSR